MSPEEKDPAYVWDMLEYAREAARLVEGVSWADYESRRELQLALERCLELVGEAARRVSEITRRAHPAIEWAKIIGLRNVLAHALARDSSAMARTTQSAPMPPTSSG